MSTRTVCKVFRSALITAALGALLPAGASLQAGQEQSKTTTPVKPAIPAKLAVPTLKLPKPGAVPQRPGSPATTTGARPTTGSGITNGNPTGIKPTSSLKPATSSGITTGNRSRPSATTPTKAQPSGGGVPRNANPRTASTVTTTKAGDQVRRRSSGAPADVHIARSGMNIHHGLTGNARSSVERPDHSRVVAESGGRGYVQRPYFFAGHEYGQRTYWEHGRAYDRFYARYPYHGVYLEMYAPVAYYPPPFYGWAYNPWAVPVAYPLVAWGWASNPWYGYYGFYFAPYPIYASPLQWLTDYLISSSLAEAYQAQVYAGAPPPPPTGDAVALTPQVKDMIAAEVQRQIAIENREAVEQAAGPNPTISGVQRMLSDNMQHVFVAGRQLDVMDATGAECALSDGDALQLMPAPLPADATAATLTVLTSKGGVECRSGALVSVGISDLQDMQNHMREGIDQGLADLRAKQGQSGLPALPPSASGMPATAEFATNAPPANANASAQISQQTQEAERAEQEVLAQAGSGPVDALPGNQAPCPVQPLPTPAAKITAGLTEDQVRAAYGEPTRIADDGTKKIFMYGTLKVTLRDGKVVKVD